MSFRVKRPLWGRRTDRVIDDDNPSGPAIAPFDAKVGILLMARFFRWSADDRQSQDARATSLALCCSVGLFTRLKPANRTASRTPFGLRMHAPIGDVIVLAG